VTEHFRLNAVYWGAGAMALLGRLGERADDDAADGGARLLAPPVANFVSACRCKCGPDGIGCGAFGPAEGHDPSLLATLSAVQVATLLNDPSLVPDPAATARWVRRLGPDCRNAAASASTGCLGAAADDGLPDEPDEATTSGGFWDGSWASDASAWPERDGRHAFAATLVLDLLGSPLTGAEADRTAAWVLRCRNPDGGFGPRPGLESHAGQCYTALGCLALLGRVGSTPAPEKDDAEEDDDLTPDPGALAIRGSPRLEGAARDKSAWWLAERQTPAGGLCGRPQKLPDVCYSWWGLASLSILGRPSWIDRNRLRAFVLRSQDTARGGISDREDTAPDVYHLFFGIASLGLIEEQGVGVVVEGTGDGGGVVAPVCPARALPRSTVSRIERERWWLRQTH